MVSKYRSYSPALKGSYCRLVGSHFSTSISEESSMDFHINVHFTSSLPIKCLCQKTTRCFHIPYIIMSLLLKGICSNPFYGNQPTKARRTSMASKCVSLFLTLRGSYCRLVGSHLSTIILQECSMDLQTNFHVTSILLSRSFWQKEKGCFGILSIIMCLLLKGFVQPPL